MGLFILKIISKLKYEIQTLDSDVEMKVYFFLNYFP